ncbi:MAG: bifunctional (p)ppGpp synthetase/guanosine-3',5'-bis(diphosphate) 3'-pyrophosphohydrolase [Deltaproteobacteria bacterium]|nr:MAG: bifunctional (p)ppGpp synthetase/guanosine-3',5'-bis(diphosphate) 3'-pyrophosphohydrolase [Deltaproteobacteria bacterium]
MREDIVSMAIRFALSAHEGQRRKGSKVLYIWHPLTVGRILDELGAPKRTVIAGLLHDTVEDTDVTLDQIDRYFGEEVGAIVAECTEDKSLPWEARKTRTIEILAECNRDVALVIAADKYDNLCTMRNDLQRMGEGMWQRFNRGREAQAWFHRNLLESLRKNPNISRHRIVRMFAEACEALFPEAGAGGKQ